MDRQLKILVIGHTCSPVRGSEPGGVWNWAAHLSAHHPVWLICHPQYRSEYEQLPLHQRPSGLKVHWITLPRWMDPWDCRSERGLRLHYMLWQRAALKAARRLHELHRFDIAHQVGLGTVSAPPPFWRLGIPFIWGPIGGGQVAPPSFLSYFGRAWRREWLRTCRVRILPCLPSMRRSASRCAMILTTNDATAEIATQAGGRTVRFFLDSGLSDFWLAPRPPSVPVRRDCILIYWGGLVPRKALGLGLESVSQVKDSRVRLWIAGEGPMRAEWEALATRLGIADRVRFFGHVSRERVRDLACASDAFLLTSLRESFGSGVLEAMGLGLPIITLDHHGVSAFLSDEEAVRVPVTEPAETVRRLACAIESFADMSRPARQHMAEAAWHKAKGQRWSNRAALALDCYSELLLGTAGHAASADDRGVPGGVVC
jgi:glycosyltransferase involved in cell wall biosynthesis